MKYLKLVVIAGLIFVNTAAKASIWSDLWWNPNESGWGVNISQQANILFMTFFVYGSDNKAKWYVGSSVAATSQINSTGYPVYSGDLYETTGPWLGTATFNPSSVTVRKVGTVTFSPLNTVAGQVTYSVDGTTATKSIERQLWNHIPIGYRYQGAMVVRSITNCPGTTIAVGQSENILLALALNLANSSITVGIYENGNTSPTCTLAGTYVQKGSVYTLQTSPVSGCTGGTFSFTDLVADDDGITGNLALRIGSCIGSFAYSAVRLPQ